MEETIEKAYSPKEVFTTLDIGDSTLRKWCIALEKNGYGFIRNEKNSRVYIESDLVVLRHFQNLIKQHNMQLDNAAIIVIDRFGKCAFEVSTVSVPVGSEEEQRDLERSYNEDIQELKGLVNKQNELIKDLVTRMDQQQKYIEERMNKKDELLLETLRESQETKRLLLDAQEVAREAKQVEENKPRKGFMRFFGK